MTAYKRSPAAVRRYCEPKRATLLGIMAVELDLALFLPVMRGHYKAVVYMFSVAQQQSMYKTSGQVVKTIHKDPSTFLCCSSPVYLMSHMYLLIIKYRHTFLQQSAVYEMINTETSCSVR